MSRLTNPPQWEDLTTEEIEALTEGCGVEEFDAPELWFHDDCRKHDFLYWRGGGPEDRKYADEVFYAGMKRRAQDASGPLAWLWRRLWAWVYYTAVRRLGGFFSPFGPPGTAPRTWDDVAVAVAAHRAK